MKPKNPRANGDVTACDQEPLTSGGVDAWARQLIDLAVVMAGPQFAGRSELQHDERIRFGSLGLVLTGKSVLDPTFTPLSPEDAD